MGRNDLVEWPDENSRQAASADTTNVPVVTFYKTEKERWKWSVSPKLPGVPTPLDAFEGHKRLRDAFNNARREVGNKFMVIVREDD